METLQHRRPLWIGLIACAFTPPVAYSALTWFTLLRLPFLMATNQAVEVIALIFLVSLVFSLVMTFSIGLIAVLVLKKMFRLSAVHVGVIGALMGALLGFLMHRGAQLRAAATPHLFMASASHGSALGAAIMPAWVGLVAASVLCLVAGIPVFSVRRDQVVDGASSPSLRKPALIFSMVVIVLSAMALTPLVTRLSTVRQSASPYVAMRAPRSVDAKSWDRTCPKQYASPEDPTFEPDNVDVAQLALQTSAGDSTALRKLTQFAQAGNELAQDRLGVIYNIGCHEGFGVPEDTTQAAHWLELAARQGNADAASALGVLYSRRDPPLANKERSLYWTRQAIASSSSIVVHGQVVRKELVNGFYEWSPETKDLVAQTRALAEQGNVEAQNELGEMIGYGMAGRADSKQAAAWFEKAAMRGNASAQRNLGFLYKNGAGIARNTTQMLSWFTNAAMQNDAQSAYELGNIYRFGIGVPKDLTTAAHWFAVAAEHGSITGQGELAAAYALGHGVPQDNVKAWQWFLTFLAHDKREAVFSYDTLRQLGTTMPPDQLRAARLAARAWWEGHPPLPTNGQSL
jgi:TPR repeat protein